VRGLTDKERAILTGPTGSGPFTYRDLLPLQKRGLLTAEHLGDRGEYAVTPDAALAIRLDAAARALAGVSLG
jgi:hypothetical protein